MTKWSIPIGAIAATLAVGVARAQTITTTSPLPDATEGAAYSLQLAATGGLGGYTWRSGRVSRCGGFGADCPVGTGLPPGLLLLETGLLQGTPTASGYFSFFLFMSDSTGAGTVGLFALHVTPSAGYSFSTWVPVASHTNGLTGSAWRTDVGILNPAASAAGVEIDFYGGDSGIVNRTISVEAGAQVVLADIVEQLGATGSGALEVLSDQPVKVTSRTYSRIPPDAACLAGGTEGQDYPAVASGDGLVAGQSAYLAGLVENASFRSNIALVNTGPDATTVLVELYNAAGTELAQYGAWLVPGEWEQRTQPFSNLAGQSAMDRGYARVTVQSGSGVFAFASVVDNTTNDPTTVTMQR